MLSYTPVFHVGLAPFLDADGVKTAGYQLLDPRGRAVAIADFAGDSVVRFFIADSIREHGPAFIERCIKYHRETPPTVFVTRPRVAA